MTKPHIKRSTESPLDRVALYDIVRDLYAVLKTERKEDKMQDTVLDWYNLMQTDADTAHVKHNVPFIQPQATIDPTDLFDFSDIDARVPEAIALLIEPEDVVNSAEDIRMWFVYKHGGEFAALLSLEPDFKHSEFAVYGTQSSVVIINLEGIFANSIIDSAAKLSALWGIAALRKHVGLHNQYLNPKDLEDDEDD